MQMSLSTEWASDMRFISNISLLLLFAISSILLADVTIATVTLPPFLSYSGTLAPGQDEHGGIPMGVSNEKCDDGKVTINYASIFLILPSFFSPFSSPFLFFFFFFFYYTLPPLPLLLLSLLPPSSHHSTLTIPLSSFLLPI